MVLWVMMRTHFKLCRNQKMLPELKPFCAPCMAAPSRIEGTIDFETAAIMHRPYCGYSMRTEIMISLTIPTISAFYNQCVSCLNGNNVFL